MSPPVGASRSALIGRSLSADSGTVVWQTTADWDNATDESGVAHENVANTDHTDDSEVLQGYSYSSITGAERAERYGGTATEIISDSDADGEYSLFYESGTYYLFLDDRTNIHVWTSTTPDSAWSDQGQILTPSDISTATNTLRGMDVIKYNNTYYMVGQADNTELWVASSSSLTSGWTDQGTIGITRGSLREPSWVYDPDPDNAGREFKILFNDRDTTNQTISYAYNSSPTGTFTDFGTVLTSSDTYYGSGDLSDIEFYFPSTSDGNLFAYPTISGDNRAVGKLYSTDAINWTEDVDAPVLESDETIATRIDSPILAWDGEQHNLMVGNPVDTPQTIWHHFFAGSVEPGTSEGFIRAYPLHEDTGTTVFDISGVANATNNGATVGQSGILGTTAYTFNGTSDWLDAGSPDVLNGAFAIMAWVRTSATDQQVVTKNSNGESDEFWFYINSSGQIAFHADGADRLTGSTTVNDGNWHRIGVGRDGGDTLTLWVDGVSDASTTYSTDRTTGATCAIGRQGEFDQGYYNGDMADVRIKGSETLTASEWQSDYDIVNTAGSLTTSWKSFDAAATQLTTTSAIDANASLDVIVEQDTNNDDIADNSQTVTLSGGSDEVNSLSNFAQTTGRYRVVVQPDQTDIVSVASLQKAEVA